MRKTRLITAVTLVALAAVVLAGGLVASNMGFKLNRTLVAADGGVTSNDGLNTLALPYNRQIGIDTAQALFSDIGGGVLEIRRFNPSNDSFTTYGFGLGDFPLETATGYFVKTLADNPYIVVGSHDPSYVVPLKAADGGVTSNDGLNFFAPPYHAVATTAQELFSEIGTGVLEIRRFNPSNDSFTTYGFGLGDYPLAVGEAYVVKTLSDINYQPAHY